MRREMGDVVVVPKQKKTPQNEGFAMRSVRFRRNIPEKKKKGKKKRTRSLS
jgi:hypothetical protein